MRQIRQPLLAGLTLVLAGTPAGAAGTLSLYVWPNYMPQELLDRFGAETGIKAATDFFESNEALLANLRAGTGLYDVVPLPDFMVATMIDEGLLIPTDVSAMENFKNVEEAFADPWFDPGRRFTAPFQLGTVGLFYDSAQIGEGVLEESWKEYFEPRPELIGKVVALDDQNALYRAAAFYAGVDPCTENAEEAQKILDVLLAQKNSLAFYDTTEDAARIIELFTDKKIAMGQMWNSDVYKFKNQFFPSIHYMYPKEGVEAYGDNLAVPANAPHSENARIFINWMMDPKNIAEVSNFNFSDNAIAGSGAYMDTGIVEDLVINPPDEYTERFREVKNCSRAARDLSDKVWARLWPRQIGPPP